MPKVSVCIPCYNEATLLKKALDSVLKQDYTDYEIIVSDDSDNNSVRDLLNGYTFGEKLRYFKNDPGLGSPGNWNYAMKQAKGEYVKILHHDDYFTSSQSLGKFVKMLDENPGVSFAFSGTEIDLISLHTKKTNSCSSVRFLKLATDPSRLFFYNCIGAPSATIVRNTRELFDENLKWLVDIEWYIRLIRAGGVTYTKEPLICTIHGSAGQITQSVQNERTTQVREHVYLFDKLYNDKLDLKKFSLLFQLLFNRFEINSLQELNVIIPVPGRLDRFFNEVFSNKNNVILLKKIKYLLGKRTFNDHLFTIKTLFK